MIWPFVSRAEHNRQAQSAVDAAARDTAAWWSAHLERMVTAQNDRYDALLDKYHELRLAGAFVPGPAPAPAAKPAPDPVTQAIILKAGSSRQLRKHYADFVTEQRTAGVSDEEIAQAIIQGVTDDEGVA